MSGFQEDNARDDKFLGLYDALTWRVGWSFCRYAHPPIPTRSVQMLDISALSNLQYLQTLPEIAAENNSTTIISISIHTFARFQKDLSRE